MKCVYWKVSGMLLKRGAGNGERKSGNELSAETSTKIQNGGPKRVTIFHGRRGRVSFRYSIN